MPYAQYFDGPDFPADWTQTSTVGIAQDRWFAGNSALYCNMAQGVGITRLISPQISTTGVSEIIVQFVFGIGMYDLGTVFKLQYSPDLENWYDTDWAFSTVGYNLGGQVTVVIANLDASATYFAWTMEGDQMGIEGVSLDNIRIHLRVTPEVQISADGLLSWEAIPYAQYFDLYSADDPYGEFELEGWAYDNFWQTNIYHTKRFFQVKAIY